LTDKKEDRYYVDIAFPMTNEKESRDYKITLNPGVVSGTFVSDDIEPGAGPVKENGGNKKEWVKLRSKSELDEAGLWDEMRDKPVGTWLDIKTHFDGLKDFLLIYEENQFLRDDDLITYSQFLFFLYKAYLHDDPLAFPQDQDEAEDYLSTSSNQAFVIFREKMAKGLYEFPPGEFPRLDICGGKVKGWAIIKPENVSPVINEQLKAELQETMRRKVLDIAKRGDLAADVFTIITAKWLREARHDEAMITITADEIMEARGLKKQKAGSGRRGGYKEEWRQEIAEQIDTLSQHWIVIGEMDVWQEVKGKRKKVKWQGEGRAINLDMRYGQARVDGSTDAFAWYIRPGSVFSRFLFGPGRETALLSCKALQYDYYRQKLEKRLAYYLAYIWRIDEGRTLEGLLARTLLEKAGMEVDKRQPSRTRDRLHKALDQLKEDAVISWWEYEDPAQATAADRQWAKRWVDAKILIEAPEAITKHYLPIRNNRTRQLKGKS
jgi:hypothetical protein